MHDTLRLCLAQMTSTDRHGGNVRWMRAACARAAAEGARMLALPEAAGLLNRDAAAVRAAVVDHARDPFVGACREEAARWGIWIHTGSTPVLAPDRLDAGPDGGGPDGPLFLNHSDLIDPSGAIVATYDKIHLFDVQLEGRAPTGESRRYAPGGRAVLAPTPWGPMGMSVCYDVRFPALYRDYARAGATVLFVPSAFTVPTGRAHWRVLLRARAIETGAFVVAAAQVGRHDDGRETWGHAMVVGPWGEVLADLGGEAPGLMTLDLQMGAVAAARRQIPSLRHGRDYRFDPSDARAAE